MVLRADYTMHQSDLGDFLAAPIWDERNGSALSILSALARLDMDPWEEAARLAALQRDDATTALAAILARLPAPGPETPDHIALACRLVALLPNRRPAAGRRTDDTRGQEQPRAERSTVNLTLLLALAAVLGFFQANGWPF